MPATGAIVENERTAGPGRDNYIGAIRLGLAVLVLYSHCYFLTGAEEPVMRLTHGALFIGRIAVNAFFLISGYLIAASWFNTHSAERFIVKRIARIYPGYWVALIFSVVIGAIFSSPNSIPYLKRVILYHDDIVRALLFLTYGGLDKDIAFPHNPVPNIVNGSLWTLQPEMVCYLLVLAFGSFGLLKRGPAALFAFAIAVLFAGLHAFLLVQKDNYWNFIACFTGGTIFYLYRESVPRGRPWLVTLAAAILFLCLFAPVLYALLFPVLGSYVILAIGFARPPRFLSWKTDLSYGVYIYAYPVQQACVTVLHSVKTPALLFAISGPIVLILAWISWHCVEHPMMKLFRGHSIRTS